MSELIKREDAINAVEMFFKDAYIEDADVHCTDMVYEINHIPAASPWHRVEDELPEPGQDVLVRTYFYGRSIYAVAWLDNEGKWSFGTVTHWIPIEPPKEDA